MSCVCLKTHVRPCSYDKRSPVARAMKQVEEGEGAGVLRSSRLYRDACFFTLGPDLFQPEHREEHRDLKGHRSTQRAVVDRLTELYPLGRRASRRNPIAVGEATAWGCGSSLSSHGLFDAAPSGSNDRPYSRGSPRPTRSSHVSAASV